MLTFSPPGRSVTAIPFVAALAVIALHATAVEASSGDAWTAFRVEVEATCRNAADGVLENPEIIVDPFGSESYGIAVLIGLERGGGDKPRMLACVFDKVSRSAEIGTTLDLPGTSTAR